VQRASGTDLYGGTAGVALFMALLLEQHPDAVLEETLEGAVAHVLAAPTDAPLTYGYYSGTLGTAAALITIGERLGRPAWAAAGWERLAQLCTQPPQPTELDVISGVAGAIPMLLRLHGRRPEPWLKAAAVRGGDLLVASAAQQGSTWAWSALPGQPPLTGYSHGAAGMALALLELYRETGTQAYFAGAMGGFNFERQHFNSQVQNWPDLRERPAAGPLTYGEAWCHGAPGIALSRLRAWQLTGDNSFRQEAETALATTHRGIHALVSNPTASVSFSLCHGLAGNADIMLEGSRVLGTNVYRQVAEAAGHYGLVRYQHTGLHWPSGVNDPTGATPGMGEAPGLLLGLAGTGYFYLRLAFPDKIDSLLLL
jgi:lantibiotic modifying enzyme